jgi:D-xylose transport system substrate-binding protein
MALSLLIGLTLARREAGSQRGNETGSRDRVLIGFSMDTLQEARWQRDRDIFVARAEALGADVLVQSANSDDTRQMQDVQALLSREVDVLVIVPHNGAAMAKAVRLAHEAGIPVIAYDRLIPDCDLDLYITFDNVRVGEMQAQYMVDALGGRGRIVRILGANTDNNAHLLKQGHDNILGPYLETGELEIAHEDWAANWKPEQAKKITNAAISRLGGESIDGILTSNDGTAGGAIQALIEDGLKGTIVTGQDAELVACQRIVDGSQAMTVYKPIAELATRAADAAYRLGAGRAIIAAQGVDNGKIEVPAILVDVTIVSAENMLDTVIADGFHRYGDVYRNVAEDVRPPRPEL